MVGFQKYNPNYIKLDNPIFNDPSKAKYYHMGF